MFLIFEGPDGSGKTSLIHSFLQRKPSGIPSSLSHFSNPKTMEERASMFEMYRQTISDLWKFPSGAGRNPPVLFDRSWLSEMVYGPLFRGGSCISNEQMLRLEDMLPKGRSAIVYCTACVDTMWARCCARGEAFVKEKAVLSALSDGYLRLMLYTDHQVPVFIAQTNQTCEADRKLFEDVLFKRILSYMGIKEDSQWVD